MRPINAILTIAVTSLLLSSWTTVVKPDHHSQTSENGLTLASLAVTNNRSTANNSTYYLTVTLPDRTDTEFAKLSFTAQYRDQGTTSIPFDLTSAEAFMGTPEAIGRAVGIESTWMDETGTFWIEFDPSLPPKTVLTVAFNASNLPPGSVYEYGVAAYPATARPIAVFAGNATLTIR